MLVVIRFNSGHPDKLIYTDHNVSIFDGFYIVEDTDGDVHKFPVVNIREVIERS